MNFKFKRILRFYCRLPFLPLGKVLSRGFHLNKNEVLNFLKLELEAFGLWISLISCFSKLRDYGSSNSLKAILITFKLAPQQVSRKNQVLKTSQAHSLNLSFHGRGMERRSIPLRIRVIYIRRLDYLRIKVEFLYN